MSLLTQPLRTAEFLAVDTETNGRAGDLCELTEWGAVLVGGGETHGSWSSLVQVAAPLSRGIQRFTGITQAMADAAPRPEEALQALGERLDGRVLVAHSASFDARVLAQAFDRCGLEWPAPPVLCTVAMARRLLPLQSRRKLTILAEALGLEPAGAHRALVDADTCARVFCALFPKLCAQADTVGDALALLRGRARAGGSKRERRVRESGPRRPAGARRALPELDFGELPSDPGVYLFSDAGGRVLYVGKSVSVRSRARAHFAPSGVGAEWTAQAERVDYETTRSELGALVLENRLVKRLRPPGNVRLQPDGRLVYLTCRLDGAFPVLEVAAEPSAGLAVNVGPLRGRRVLGELVEQLSSLFGLRHCGRTLKLRTHPSAYGQMGRCLSPCLGDLDPNAYRRRLDAALAVFAGGGDGRSALLAHVEAEMRAASLARRYERAAALRRRLRRLEVLLARLEGPLRATHADPRLVLARHPARDDWDAFWLAGGRLVDWGPLPGSEALAERTARAAARAREKAVAWTAPEHVDEVRIIGTWLDSHPETPSLALSPAPSVARVESWVDQVRRRAAPTPAR